MKGKIVYFDNPGVENTDETLRIARERARELDIKTVVVASTSGETAIKAVDVFEGMKVIAVSLVAGARSPNTQVFTDENRQKVESKGGKVLTTAHVFTGIEGAIRRRFDMHLFGEIIACTLRIFGHGTKVACEIALMAADAGLVRTDEEIISIGGTKKGSDTALVLRPLNSNDFFDINIREILCKPHF